MFRIKVIVFICFLAACLAAGCSKTAVKPAGQAVSLRNVPAQRLSYTFEPDTLPPVETETAAPAEERVAAVQADFDQNRPEELLDKTLPSPDKQRVAVIYHRTGDMETDFRLDMYGADGKLIHKVSPDAMAVSIPDAITWSPDGSTVAFVGVAREQAQTQAPPAADAPTPPELEGNDNTTANADANAAANSNAGIETNANANANVPIRPVQLPATVKLFSNEQVYTSSKDGADLKYVSHNDTLIYFYLLWSPDGTMLATLACTPYEWKYGELYTESKKEVFLPLGRPRLIEKIGRERLLDDNLTDMHPAWSPDSSKVAYPFNTMIAKAKDLYSYNIDVKIYDTVGETPTYATIPLRQPLLSSSVEYDENLRQQEKGNTNANAPASTPTPPPAANKSEPRTSGEEDPISFNPIVELRWTEEKSIYVRTANLIRLKLDSGESKYTFARWHKIILSAQVAAAVR
jgi:hypothetical protein